jgi:hypothetical protein
MVGIPPALKLNKTRQLLFAEAFAEIELPGTIISSDFGAFDSRDVGRYRAIRGADHKTNYLHFKKCHSYLNPSTTAIPIWDAPPFGLVS